MQREQMITVTVYIYTRYTREKLKKKRYKNKWTKKRRKYYIVRRETYRGYVNDVFAYLFTQQRKQIKSPKVLTTKSRPPRLPLSTPADGVPMAYRWRTDGVQMASDAHLTRTWRRHRLPRPTASPSEFRAPKRKERPSSSSSSLSSSSSSDSAGTGGGAVVGASGTIDATSTTGSVTSTRGATSGHTGAASSGAISGQTGTTSG